LGDYYAKDIEVAFGYRYESRKADLRWVMLGGLDPGKMYRVRIDFECAS
jgi:hypothetical protein